MTAETAPSPSDRSQRPSVAGVFEAEFGYVWNSLRRLGVREDDLKDQCQEVFLTAAQIYATYDDSRPIRPWLFGIAYRIAGRYRTKPHRRREVFAEGEMDPLEQVADARPGADTELERARRRALVVRAIDQIDFSRRAVFVMSEIDGVVMPEIAATLEIPLNTAYSRLRLARDEFASAVKRLSSGKGQS